MVVFSTALKFNIYKELALAMKSTFRIIAIISIFVLGSVATFGQDRNKVEFYGGYLFHNISTGLGEVNEKIGEDIFDNRITAHGWNLALTGNISKRVGIKFDYSSTGRALLPEFSDETDTKLRINQYLGGIQIKNNEKDGPRVKPFAHVLAGIANERIRCTRGCEFSGDKEGSASTFSESSSSFAMVFGGGIDLKVHERIDIRLIQIDYNPIFFGGVEALELPNRTQNNFRFGFGVVIH